MPSIAILQIRIYALYSLNKKVLALMLIPYIVCSAFSAWIISSDLSSAGMETPAPIWVYRALIIFLLLPQKQQIFSQLKSVSV